MHFPDTVISIAIEPKTKSDQENLDIALHRLEEEDPTFRMHIDKDTGQTLISGMGELHLEIIIDRLRREFGIAINQVTPKLPKRKLYKEVEAARSSGREMNGKEIMASVKFR